MISRLLVIDAALARAQLAVVEDGRMLVQRSSSERMGMAARIPLMLAEMLAALNPHNIDAVTVTVGPGSFTGIRAGMALAEGWAMAAGKPLIPVSVGEALRQSIPDLQGRSLWAAIDSRRDHAFLETDHGAVSCALASLPRPDGPVAVAGDAAIEVAARLLAQGFDVMLTDARQPDLLGIAAAALLRAQGHLPPRTIAPFYIDPPEAKLPAGGLRPAPSEA